MAEVPTDTEEQASLGTLGQLLRNSRLVQLGEILAVFAVGFIIIEAVRPFVGENPLANQLVVWVANVFMLLTVWLGLRLRDQGVEHFGLTFKLADRRTLIRTFLVSLVVFVAAVAGFMVGAIIMANIVGMPEGADTSQYNYLSGNLPMLLLALAGVYIVSSFGEEFIYRAFLINRLAEMGTASKRAYWLAAVISAVIFGLVHYTWGPSGIVQTGFMGFALGAAYLIAGRRLWVTILAHAYLDTILLVQMYFAPAES